MARVVRKAWNVGMAGADNHGGLYYFNLFSGVGVPPGPPVPIPPGLAPVPPFSFHPVVTTSAWPGDHKSNDTVLVEGDPIVSKGHQAKNNVHIPPGGNLLIPVTMFFASSTWMLGVGSVLCKQGPVAATMIGPAGVNYNCQDPCSAPLPNVMVATASVHVAASAADWLAAAVEMLLQSLVEFAISALLEFGPEAMKKLFTRYAKTAIGKLLGALGGALGEYGGKLLGKTLGKYVEVVGKGLVWVAGKAGVKEGLEKTAEETIEKEFKEGVKEASEKAIKKELDNYAKSGGKIPAEEAAKKAEKAGQEAAAEKALDDGLYKKHYDQTPGEMGGATAKGASGDVIKDKANNATQGARQTGVDAATGNSK